MPDESRKNELLAKAHDEAEAGKLGEDANFERIYRTPPRRCWPPTATKASCRPITPASSRPRAPRRSRWSGRRTTRPSASRNGCAPSASRPCTHSISTTLDLLRIEDDAEAWETIGTLAAREIEHAVLTSDLAGAQQLADSIAGAATGERALHAAAQRSRRGSPAGRSRGMSSGNCARRRRPRSPRSAGCA